MDELLYTRIEYRSATNALPETRLIALSEIFEGSDSNLQVGAIQDKISQLNYTVPHMAPEVAAIALAYKKTLETYLQKRNVPALRPSLPTTPTSLNRKLLADTLRHLSQLDDKRKSLSETIISSFLK